MKTTLVFLLCILLGACSSLPTQRVLERADNLGSAPNWASITLPSYTEGNKQYFLGWVEVDGEASKAAALNMADEKAFSEPLRSLTDEFLDQNQVGEELRKSASIGQRVLSATRGYRPPMPSLHIVKRYWEIVFTPDQRLELRAYALAEIPVAELEQAKRAYLNRLAGNSEVRSILHEVGAKQRQRVLATQAE